MNRLTTLAAVATLAAGVVCSTQTFAGEALEIYGYHCYNAKFAGVDLGGPQFEPREVLFTNPLDPKNTKYTARSVQFVCAAVNKDGEEIIDPEGHLVCYSIKPATNINLEMLVTNEFGEQRLKVKRSGLLCLPSTILGRCRGPKCDMIAVEKKKKQETE